MKTKACKKCKLITEESQCPLCKGTNFTNSIKGRIFILNAEESLVAEKMGLDTKGEYAIKVN